MKPRCDLLPKQNTLRTQVAAQRASRACRQTSCLRRTPGRHGTPAAAPAKAPGRPEADIRRRHSGSRDQPPRAERVRPGHLHRLCLRRSRCRRGSTCLGRQVRKTRRPDPVPPRLPATRVPRPSALHGAQANGCGPLRPHLRHHGRVDSFSQPHQKQPTLPALQRPRRVAARPCQQPNIPLALGQPRCSPLLCPTQGRAGGSA